MFQNTDVYLNLYPVQYLDVQQRTVHRYSYSLTNLSEDSNIHRIVGAILHNIGCVVGTRLKSEIITTQPIPEKFMHSGTWSLKLQGQRQLNPVNSIERKALERLCRKQLQYSIKQLNGPRVENTGTSLILWDIEKIEKSGKGWQIFRGAMIDVVVDEEGQLSLEIDTHYRFYSPWTVHQWLEKYPDAPLQYVRNVGTEYTWYFCETTDERPE